MPLLDLENGNLGPAAFPDAAPRLHPPPGARGAERRRRSGDATCARSAARPWASEASRYGMPLSSVSNERPCEPCQLCAKALLQPNLRAPVQTLLRHFCGRCCGMHVTGMLLPVHYA